MTWHGVFWSRQTVSLAVQMFTIAENTLQWRHNGYDGVSNHQPYDCYFNRLFRRISKKTSKLRVTGLCEMNSPVTGEFLAQRASNAENVSIWRRHYGVVVSHKTSICFPSWKPFWLVSTTITFQWLTSCIQVVCREQIVYRLDLHGILHLWLSVLPHSLITWLLLSKIIN